MDRLRRLIAEMHRRSLWQVLGIYLAASWVAFEVVTTFTESLELPEWVPAFALVLLVIGLPIVLATAFVQEGGEVGAAGAEPGGPSPDRGSADAPGTADERREAAVDASGLRRVLTWRNVAGAGVLAFALWGVVAAGWVLFSDQGGPRPPEAIASVEFSENRIAVFPFGVRSGEGLAYLGDGLVNLLSTKLDGAGELRTVDPRALLSLVAQEGSASLDPEKARRVAGRVGAGLYVLGDVLEVAGRVRLDAALYEVGRAEPVARATVGGDADDIFGMVDELAARLLSGRLDSPGERMIRAAGVTTHSLPAFKAYLEGERAFRSGQFEEAIGALREAVQADSGFALAYYRMAVTAQWTAQQELENWAAEQAIRHADRLSPHDRSLLQAQLAMSRGRSDEAERRYREVVAAYPNDVEAWFQLGEVLFHYGPLEGRSISASRETWERVLTFEPAHLPSLVHLARIAAVEDRRVELDSLVRRALSLEPEGSYALYMRALRAYELGDSAAQRRLERELEDVSLNTFNNVVYNVGVYVQDLEGALRLNETVLDPGRPRGARVGGHLRGAHMELARGRRAAARGALDELAELDPATALEYRALLALAWSAMVGEGGVAPLRDSLREGAPASADSPPSADGSSPASLARSVSEGRALLRPQRRAYLLGALAARLGDPDEALRHAARLEEMETPEEAGSLASDLARGVRAEVALAAGRDAEALAHLEAIRGEFNYLFPTNSGFFFQGRERFLRAEILERAGRHDEALQWFSSFAEVAIFGLPFVAPSHLRRAEILERRGDREAALRHYRRFLELWADADPELRPLVDRARERVEALGGTGDG